MVAPSGLSEMQAKSLMRFRCLCHFPAKEQHITKLF